MIRIFGSFAKIDLRILILFFPLIIALIILIISFIGSFIKHYKEKSKVHNYKTFTKLFMCIGAIITIICIGTYAHSFKKENITNNKKTPNFTIEEYKIKMDISENNVADIEEKITVDFKSNSHGLIRSLPYWLEYTGNDNKTISRRYDIKNIEVLDEKYETYYKDERKQIKIGDSEREIIGPHTYVIKYQYNMGNDPYNGYDEFIFHAFGDNWHTAINNASIEINMPKRFREDDLKLFLDKYRNSEVTGKMNIDYVGNTINISIPQNNKLNKSLTIDLVLPDNYFINTSSSYGYGTLFTILIIIILFIIIIIMWLRYGKDYKIDKDFRSSPPEEYDAASIGYIYKGTYGSRLLVATIMELANKDAITIESTNTRKIKLYNNNTKDLNLPSNQKIVFNNLFREGDAIELPNQSIIQDINQKLNINLQQELDEKIQDLKSVKKMFKSSRFLVYAGLLWLIGFKLFKDLDPRFHFLYLITLILLPILFIFTIIMKRRTEYGARIFKEIKEYKDYIYNIDDQELISLNDISFINCNKLYTYAYIFEISKCFDKKLYKVFNDKSTDYIYYDDRLIRNMDRSISISSRSSGSCSSCGGGCSSCGGGCSSCGGGGSW